MHQERRLNYKHKSAQNTRIKLLFVNYSSLNTVHDLKIWASNCHTVFKKTSKKCNNLGTFTQTASFLDYNKTKKETSVTIWKNKVWQFGKKVWQFGKKCDNLGCDNLRLLFVGHAKLPSARNNYLGKISSAVALPPRLRA